MRSLRLVRSVALALLLGLLACDGGDSAFTALPPRNVLARRFHVDAPGATAAHAEWTEEGEPRASPPIPVPLDGQADVDVLGLLPSTSYQVVVVVDAPTGRTRLGPFAFHTPRLPPGLAGITLAVAGNSPPGYLLMNVAGRVPATMVAFDGRGRLRWYRVFQGSDPLVESKQLPGGNFIGYLGRSSGSTPAPGRYVEVSPAGELIRSFSATSPLYTDPHEALVTGEGTPDERIHLFGYESRTVDLAPLGLPGTGAIVGHTVQRLRPDGTAEFSWNAFDHLALDELVNPVAPGGPVGSDYDHPNSLDLDGDGNYLVSWRNLDAVLLIDAHTGEIRWRLGGTRSDFTFVDDPLGGFSGQHDARLLPGGHLLVLDNGTLHSPPTTRAVEYALDAQAGTATLVWEWRAPADRWDAFMGSARRDAAGMTWVGLSMLGIVDRVAADGTVDWEGHLLADGRAGIFYRAVPIDSLYGTPPPTTNGLVGIRSP